VAERHVVQALTLDDLRDRRVLLRALPTVDVLVGADPQPDRELRTGLLADEAHDVDEHAGAVLDAAAVLVGPHVLARRQERRVEVVPPRMIRPTPPLARSCRNAIVWALGRPSASVARTAIGPMTIRFAMVSVLIVSGWNSTSAGSAFSGIDRSPPVERHGPYR